jgi:hypothetical protein
VEKEAADKRAKDAKRAKKAAEAKAAAKQAAEDKAAAEKAAALARAQQAARAAPAPERPAPIDWHAALRADLNACAQQSFFQRPACVERARKKHCPGHWDQTEECKIAAVISGGG